MHRAFILLIVILLTGCASEPYTQRSGLVDRDADKYQYQLYGKIEKINEQYSFTRFSEDYDRKSAWVRLSDMRPMWNVHQEDCLTGADVAGLKRQCMSENPDLFRFKQTDFTAKKSAGYVIMTAFTLGMGAASPPAAVKFNGEKFSSAVSEAIQKLNGNLKTFGYGYTKILSDYNAEKIKFNKTYKEIVSDYKVQANPIIRLKDLSGLSEKKAGDFVNHISITPNTIVSKNENRIIKAKELSNLLFLVRNQNSTTLTKLQEQVAFFNVSCERRIFSNINYELYCPKTITANATTFDVNVSIESVSFDNVLPRHLLIEDEFLSVQLIGGKFIFSNKSSSYITVDSLSFYHNGKIASLSALQYELAPNAQTLTERAMRIDSLNLDKQAIRFPNTTAKMAKKTKVEYGGALKYRIIDLDKEKTLLRKKDFLLSELL